SPRQPPRPPNFPYTTLFRSEWGGYGNTHTVVDWTVIADAASAAAFAEELARTTPMRARRTGISGAIDHGTALFDRRRFDGRRRVDRKSTRLNSSHVKTSYAV